VRNIYASIGLRAAIDYYGGCSEPAMQGDVPLPVLAGEPDDWGDAAADRRLGQSHEDAIAALATGRSYDGFDPRAADIASPTAHLWRLSRDWLTPGSICRSGNLAAPG
jgi:dienelactone hydrolase